VGPKSLSVKVDDLLANIRKSVDSDIESLSGGTPTQTRGTLMRGALREMRISLGTEAETRAAVKEEISDLRSRIQKKMDAMEADSFAQTARVAPQRASTAVVPTRGDFSGILSGPTPRQNGLRPGYAGTDTRDDLRYAAPRAQEWQHTEQAGYGYEQQDEFQQPDPYAHGHQEQGYQERGHQDRGYQEQTYEEQSFEQQYQQPQLEAPLVSPQTEAHAETAFRQLSDAILARATGDRSLEDMTREMLKGMLKQWLDANLPAIVEDMVREEIQRVARRGR
jgi:cell pole-organizing protein PopZ